MNHKTLLLWKKKYSQMFSASSPGVEQMAGTGILKAICIRTLNTLAIIRDYTGYLPERTMGCQEQGQLQLASSCGLWILSKKSYWLAGGVSFLHSHIGNYLWDTFVTVWQTVNVKKNFQFSDLDLSLFDQVWLSYFSV